MTLTASRFEAAGHERQTDQITKGDGVMLSFRLTFSVSDCGNFIDLYSSARPEEGVIFDLCRSVFDNLHKTRDERFQIKLIRNDARGRLVVSTKGLAVPDAPTRRFFFASTCKDDRLFKSINLSGGQQWRLGFGPSIPVGRYNICCVPVGRTKSKEA